MKLRSAYAAALTLCIGVSAKAATKNQGDITLIPLPPKPFGLIGGESADPKDYPASVYAAMGNSRCTATVVGPQVLLIAAHCVGNGATAAFSVAGKSYSSTCTHHSDYRVDPTADYALCKITSKVTDVPYEVINTDASLIKVGAEITLTGYGCTQPGGGGGNDGTYRTGKAKAISVHEGNQDIVTKGGAALCFGDSGGPAFYPTGNKTRVQISVNSRGDIRTTSYLSSLTGGKFKPFLADFIAKNTVKICGVDGFNEGCRGATPTPPGPSPLPEHCADSLKVFTSCLYGTPRLAQTDPETCRETYAELFACEEAAELQEGGE